jgi:[ribosomal protein S5]-alanine N-acetyltransferase
MKAPVLISDRLILKPLSLQHLSQDYVSWLNDAEVYKFLETGGNYSIEQLREYLEEVEKKDILFWGIHLKESDSHIGNIKIDPVNKRHGLGEYGIMMGRKSEWGKGFAMEATSRVIDYCFQESEIRKITLGVVADNHAALRLYKKLGFITEGIYKDHGLYNGKYCDIVRMALFNPSFGK